MGYNIMNVFFLNMVCVKKRSLHSLFKIFSELYTVFLDLFEIISLKMVSLTYQHTNILYNYFEIKQYFLSVFASE